MEGMAWSAAAGLQIAVAVAAVAEAHASDVTARRGCRMNTSTEPHGERMVG
jgi:hypothetical protein